MKYLLPIGLVLLSLGLAGFFVYVATFRSLTPLEGALSQVFILLAGLGGSWWFGRQSAVNRPHARSAFRRVTSLYLGLSTVASTIEESRNHDSVEEYRLILARLEGVVSSQLIAADDALADWEDIVPREVSDLRKELRPSNQNQE